MGQLLSTQLDYVVDAIDSLRAKAALIAWCRRHKVPVVVSGGAGGKTDPTRIVVDDLSRTTDDPMASKLRYTLRRQHGFARDGKFGVPCVFSTEPLIRLKRRLRGGRGWRSGFEPRRVWFGDGGNRWFWLGGGQPGAARSGAPGALAAAGPCIKPAAARWKLRPDARWTPRAQKPRRRHQRTLLPQTRLQRQSDKSACQHAVCH